MNNKLMSRPTPCEQFALRRTYSDYCICGWTEDAHRGADAVRAEQAAELARLREGIAAMDDLLKTGGINDPWFHLGAVRAIREEGARLREDNERLREAVMALTKWMDRAGGDADGMPECPWCHSGPDGDDHRSDCELARARELLEALKEHP